MLRRAFLSVVASFASVGLLRVRPAAGDDPLCGTGRTSACIFEAFAEALRNPNEWILFKNHEPMSEDVAASLAPHMVHLAHACGLKLKIIQEGAGIIVCSPIDEIRNGTYRPQRPPLGVIPSWLWVEQRVQDLRGALERADGSDPEKIRLWTAELFHHVEWLQTEKPDSPEIRGVACVDPRVGKIINDYGGEIEQLRHDEQMKRHRLEQVISRLRSIRRLKGEA